MVEDFAPFGMRYFLLDDGWQMNHGDWVTHETRFPSHDGKDGMAWLAEEIKSRGLIPGVWIAPFWIKPSSKLAQEHPDWFAQASDLGGAVLGTDALIPDLTLPEVQDWIREVFHRITQEWGYRFIKMDFSYYALFAENLSDPTKTASQAYHEALAIIREAIGPETFFLTISAMGLCFDSGNGSRLTLDNEPMWGDDAKQGIKVTLLTAAHRYYLNWLWANHPDLLFYRDNMGLTLSEARTWTSMVALLGGIVKLGETYTAMHEHPEWLAMVRPLLPVYPVSARPLDMFELKYPEVWALHPEREGREWVVLGLFNWGLNEEVFSGDEVAEETRTKEIELAAVGLVPTEPHLVLDAWTHECEWVEGGSIARTLVPRTEAVLIVHPEPDEPMIVATSRHLLGGAVEVSDEWVKTSGEAVESMGATIDHPAGFPLEVYLYAGGAEPKAVASPAGAILTPGGCEGVYVVSVIPESSPVEIKVEF
jgi:alpha-galactosidase